MASRTLGKVFFSHVHEDADCAEKITTWLQYNLNHGIECFSASDAGILRPGTMWAEEIKKALQDADLLIVLVSPNSLQREWIYFEAGCGFVRDIPVIPVCCGGITKADLTPPLSLLQALNLPEESIKLIRAVANVSGMTAVRRPTKLLLPALTNSKFIWKPHP
ncbi:MAG: toll/interleukin-1 receptor domain-containing protein [Chloroflexi bacterium]|nr:toll/interleukin-1 receptor domain-containing protein [Chloroflexota bacterium]